MWESLGEGAPSAWPRGSHYPCWTKTGWWAALGSLMFLSVTPNKLMGSPKMTLAESYFDLLLEP